MILDDVRKYKIAIEQVKNYIKTIAIKYLIIVSGLDAFS